MVGSSVAAVIVAEAVRPQPSFLGWILFDVHGIYGLGIAVAAILSVALTVILARRGQGDWVGTALVLIVPLPLVVGLGGAFDGGGVACAGLASGLRLIDVADPLARALFCPMTGMSCSSPAFIIAIVSSYRRSTTAARNVA